MKILLLSWYFPPANDVGALRLGKLAEYLRDGGNDVWVITGDRDHRDLSQFTSFPEEQIVRTRWFDVNTLRISPPRTPASSTRSLHAEIARPKFEHLPARSMRQKLSFALRDIYLNTMQIPDRQIGWLPYLKRAGRTLLRNSKFDLIYASGPPFSTFVGAKSLSQQFSVPWIGEYRDGWSRYVYNPKPRLRQAIDELIENLVTPTASALVAVTEPWAEYYRKRFDKPTIAIYNGFDSENFLSVPARLPTFGEPLSIIYVGTMYEGLRDPSVLYAAIARSQISPSDLQIFYYGPSDEEIYALAAKFGVAPFVTVRNRVSYAASLELQRKSDVLLLLQSPHDSRNVPAKLFEYLAARRPILGLGLDDGIPAKLIIERGAGFYRTNTDAVAAQLDHWVAQKKKTGIIPDLAERTCEGLSRKDQFCRLLEFLSSFATQTA